MASDNKALHSTIPTLEPVADMAARLAEEQSVEDLLNATDEVFAEVITADREQIAAMCEQKAAEAATEAAKHMGAAMALAGLPGGDGQARTAYTEAHQAKGRADAFRAMAAMLRGGGK